MKAKGKEKAMSFATMMENARNFEVWERYALDNLECRDCNVSLAKISAGEYYCPSCGMECSE